MLRYAYVLLGLAIASTGAQAASLDSKVTVVNRSAWEIHQLFLSPVDEDEWGPDQLGEDIIEAEGGSFTLSGIPCDSYDIRLIDEDGDECVVADVALCADRDKWVIDDADLLVCQAETE